MTIMVPGSAASGDDGFDAVSMSRRVESTGRFVVVFADDDESVGVAALRAAGLGNVARSSDLSRPDYSAA
jgi:hypothetical protein